ncbi:MAG: DNA uptake protein [Phormidesmis priestleyi]|uniref:DNA uptake protein n=1 Tax=Phormidesmis priestleyi TaxID=268141 RepID=A0A2W4X4I0_9CYAN|nr:MAG: DNA uptake protein [Phormidesmis priestleyi]
MFKNFLNRAHPLRRSLQQEPYYRFRSFAELDLAASWGLRIEANTASIDDWLRLPGISIHQARSLYQLTQSGLSFNCIEDVAAALSLPVQQISPWQSVLQFCYYDLDLRLEAIAIDANQATADELATIPAVDIFLARAMVHYRQTGPYKDLADLQKRLRLTTAVAVELLHYLRF